MAAKRSRRDNAGAKMSGLLDKEEEDDFYKTTYGGFSEEGDDRDFNYNSPNEDEDEVDSDFSIDENEEVKSDPEDDESNRKKAKRSDGVQTKAYKEPSKKKDNKSKQKVSKPKPKPPVRMSSPEYGRRLTTRASTALKTSETIKILKQRDAESRRKKLKLKKKQKVERKLTQEEILEEAKVTEKFNLESLKKYEEMELEAKRRATRSGDRTVKGPAIRYHSVTMPIIQEVKEEEYIKTETSEDSKDDDDDNKPGDTKKEVHGKQERTFISFTDADTMKKSFPRGGYRVPSSKICPVTRLPAKYFDPVTELPYANLQAFKIIREAYYQQLESRGDRTDPEISSWLDWREKNKPAKQILVSVNRPPQAFTSLAAAPARPVVKAAPAPAPVVVTTKQQVVLPTRPLPVTTQPTAVTTTVQSIRLPTSPAVVNSLPVGRTIATTTLTAAQLQQLAAARGQVFVSALQTQMRAGTAQVAVAGGAAGMRQVTAQLARGGQIVRQGGQTSLIVSQQPRQTLAVQRPIIGQQMVAGQTVGVVARTVAGMTRGTSPQIMMATSPAGGVRAGGQIMVQGAGGLSRAMPGQLVMASAGQLRQGGVMVVTTSAPSHSGGGVIVQSTTAGGVTRQHYVISGTQSGGQAQIVALQPGQTVRPGQIVQVASQQGQHQIVVSNSGQIVLQPPTSKQI
eukprot:GFUD01019446.1.p1 GENE.GFUD01019446.1~~GFUD01019446.1.p1  ORF type:complete len:681 (-),score=224.23 GFUD01019446.1:108-2150(-)